MPDNHYENPKLAAIYDFDSGWSVDRDFYLALATDAPQRILDLGCGTGLICDAFAAKGHLVTGVDPSAAMLDVARRKPHGGKIQWVQSFSQTFESDETFDLIIMTGHAFQVLIEDEDIRATFNTIEKLLSAEGSFVFESRNPAINWASQWDYEMDLKLAGQTVRESRKFLTQNGERMSFELKYEFPDETLISNSELRFSDHLTIDHMLNDAGLRVEKLLGDWSGGPFNEMTSEEMIFVVRCA
jgi:ubiquinone/menaquinone biosynthesis C-methylase UbiE